MSIGSISDCLASSIAFSEVPPMPMPSIPGGHHPAPIVGTVFSTHSTTESEGSSMMNFDFASDPPPLAATVISTVLPLTSSTVMHEGVLSLVFFRAPAGRKSSTPLWPEQVAKHPATSEWVVQMQLVDAPHQPKIFS